MTDANRRQPPASSQAAANSRYPGDHGSGGKAPQPLGSALPGIRPRASGQGVQSGHFVAPTGSTRPLSAAQVGELVAATTPAVALERPRAPAIAGAATLAPLAVGAAPTASARTTTTAHASVTALPVAAPGLPFAAATLPHAPVAHGPLAHPGRSPQPEHGSTRTVEEAVVETPSHTAPLEVPTAAPAEGTASFSTPADAMTRPAREAPSPATSISADDAVRSLAATIEDLLAKSELPTPRSFDVLRIPGEPARRTDDAKPLAAPEGRTPARSFRGRQLPPPPPVFKIASAESAEVSRTGDLVGDIASEIARQLRGIDGQPQASCGVTRPDGIARDTGSRSASDASDVHDASSLDAWPPSHDPHDQPALATAPGVVPTAAAQPAYVGGAHRPVQAPPIPQAARWHATEPTIAPGAAPAARVDARSLAITAAERYEPAVQRTDWYGVPIEAPRASEPAESRSAAEAAYAIAAAARQAQEYPGDHASSQVTAAAPATCDPSHDYGGAERDDTAHVPMDSPRIVTSRMIEPVPANTRDQARAAPADDSGEQLPRWLSLSRDAPATRRAGRTGLLVGGALAAAALIGYAGAGSVDLVRNLWSLPEGAMKEPAAAAIMAVRQPEVRGAGSADQPAKAALMALLGGQDESFGEATSKAAASEGATADPVRTATLAAELPAATLPAQGPTAATGSSAPIYAEAKVTVPTADEVRAFLQALRRGDDRGETRSAALARAEATAADAARLDSQRGTAATSASSNAPVPEPVPARTEAAAAPATGGVSTIKRSAPASIPEGAPISGSDAAGLFARVREYLDKSDVASARLLLEHLAHSGSREAAERLARSYDPAHIADLSVAGLHPDRDKAIKWYRKAAELGSVPAGARLVTLEQTLPPRN